MSPFLPDDHTASDIAEHPQRSLQDCAASFYDDASALHHAFDGLSRRFSTLRALSARLAVLHPNDLATPTLALDLRDALLDAARRLGDLDDGTFRLWEDEERVRLACASGAFSLGEENTAAVGDQDGELAERREEVHGVVRRLGRRVKEVRREAKGEAKDRRRSARKEGSQGNEPDKVNDYLEEGVYEFPHLLTKDTVHASRWVVENPFTILARLADDLKTLKVPQLVKTESTPATYVRPPAPPPLYHFAPFSPSSQPEPRPTAPLASANPTPSGSSYHPVSAWKHAILADAARRKGAEKDSSTHRFVDEVDSAGAEGVKEVRVATERGRRERWVILLVVALFPILLVANLVEDILLSRRASHATPKSTSPASTAFLSLRSMTPTMVGARERATATGVAGGPGEERELRERRRRSAEFEGALV
ncbi:hypothetical protein JCM3770_000295 [Rhodotorula araucariae]